MKNGFLNIFRTPPTTGKAHETPIYLLHVVLKYSFLASLFITIVAVYARWPITGTLTILLCIILAIVLFVTRAGHVKTASFMASAALLIVAIVSCYEGDGITDVAILIFPGIIVIAAFFLDKKIFLMMTILSIASISLVPIFRRWNGIPNINENELYLMIMTAVFILAAISMGIRALFVYLLEALDKSRINEKKYRNIFNNIHDVYYEMDRQGRILEVSPSVALQLNVERERLLNQSILPLYKNQNLHEFFISKLSREGEVRNFEVEFNDRDNVTHNVSINAMMHRSEHPESDKIVGTIRDITNQRQLEEQLLQSQKLDSIGRLAGGVAHDFNNLLTIINGHCEIAMSKNRKGTGTLRADLDAIWGAGQKAAGLTQQLLAFSRKQVYQPKIINPDAVITNLEKMVRRLIGEDIEIKMKQKVYAQALIEADPTQIEQIIINLLVNARDALQSKTSAEKRISIETAVTHLSESYSEHHPGSRPGSFYVLSISDTGIGMRPEVRQRIFEPFFTTKTSGTGLGLSMVYGLVHQQKGFINVYSEPGFGTTFRIYWPLAAGKKAVSEKAYSPQQLKGKERVLLVEDDHHVREYASTVLNNYGYDVLLASDGAEAEQLFRTNKDKIDLVITDLIMPRMNGMALGERIKLIRNDIPILYISGYTDDHISSNEILETGLNYLQKPFTSKDLVVQVREILNSRN